MQLQSRYVDALIREMMLRRNEAKGNISTIYLGGGTPSTLSFDDLHRLFIYIYKVYDFLASQSSARRKQGEFLKKMCANTTEMLM